VSRAFDPSSCRDLRVPAAISESLVRD
jgi:hypothetical protein